MKAKRLRHIERKKMTEDCWSLDESFYAWLLPRLKIYLKEAPKTVDDDERLYEYKGTKYSLRELIIKLIDALESRARNYMLDVDEETKLTSDILNIWALICPAMWW